MAEIVVSEHKRTAMTKNLGDWNVKKNNGKINKERWLGEDYKER